MKWWPFGSNDSRKQAKQLQDRLERQEPEVRRLVRELRQRRRENSFREDFGKTLRGEV